MKNYRIFIQWMTPLNKKMLALLTVLVLANGAAWVWAYVAFGSSGMMMGMALLAYTFGLRHAVDADHIAAIDNVTRKLMGQNKRSWDVGLYFSLGHSTVVIGLSMAVALVSGAMIQMDGIKATGAIIGTGVSALFLVGIGIANLGALKDSWGRLRALRQGRLDAENTAVLAIAGGFMGRLFARMFHLIDHGWQMYPLGFLFGLGFDTATEVGLLGLSAGQAQTISLGSILVFPTLFMVGMSLIDTLDSAVMAGAYRWAFVKPVRKIYYNLTITFISVAMALVVGGVEVLGLAADRLGLDGAFWSAIVSLNDHFELVGIGMIGLFIACWAVSILVYWLGKYDGLDAQMNVPAE